MQYSEDKMRKNKIIKSVRQERIVVEDLIWFTNDRYLTIEAEAGIL